MLQSTFLELVSKRRSIRKYKPLPVEREKLLLCLEAARLAPSACNAQPYRFIVVDEPELKEKVSKAAFSGVYSGCKFAAGAGALVFVVSETGKFSAWLGNRVQSTDFRLVDIGIAAEHFVLAASEQGLGTCWLGWFNAKSAARALGLGPGKKVEIMLSVGYPDEDPSQRKRKNMEEFSVFNNSSRPQQAVE
ncbi:MAG TPA: NAD(P)H nitroreductase [Elusimicrobia bacterium]|nr:NAD(P)H nitroreductase [Elusimicrobiota bacterium]